MKKKSKGLQYRLEKERDLWISYTGSVLSISALVLEIMVWIEDKEFPSDGYIPIVILLAYIFYLFYANHTKTKKFCFGME